jgi:uncharacterized membrane protein YraQ (UPF0718 family)
MKRKAFWKTRRFWGVLVGGVAFAAEVSGLVPSETVVTLANQLTIWAGTLVGIWGAIQADAPMGLK